MKTFQGIKICLQFDRPGERSPEYDQYCCCWHFSLTFFVEKILTTDRTIYESKKPRRIWWYYGQWQGSYKVMQSSIGKEIQFIRGLPAFKEDLREIDPKFNNVLVFYDLMAQATGGQSSRFPSRFTQGRHRNASVILLLQYMFPKG